MKTNIYVYDKCKSKYDNNNNTDNWLARKILKQKLKEDYDINLNDYKIKYGEKNKPYIDADICFNITHSQNIVAVVISCYNCGIDVEAIKDRPKLDRLAEKTLSSKELEEYEKTSDKVSYFIKLWTVKEAYSKYQGTGIILSELVKDSPIERAKIWEISDKENNKYYLTLMIDNVSEILLKEINI